MKWVKLRIAKGLPKRHGITSMVDDSKEYILKGGEWLPDVDGKTAAYLNTQYGLNGEKLVVLAANEDEALQIATDEAREGAPGEIDEPLRPATFTNADLMRRATTRAASAAPETARAPVVDEPAPVMSKSEPKTSTREPDVVENHSVNEVYARLSAVVGRKIAAAVKDAHGDGLTNVLRHEPDLLLEIDGIGANRLEKILEAVRDVV